MNSIGASPTGYALARTLNNTATLMELGPDLSDLCGPIELPDQVLSRNLQFTGSYWIGFAQPASNLPSLIVVEAGCGASVVVALTSSSNAYPEGTVASGPRGSAVVWSGPNSSVNYRVLGPHLCDAPVP